MRVPSATYRVQFNLNFRFSDAEALVPYLFDLGVSHLYVSPRFKARKGSSHGYDVADPWRINSELGTEEEYDRLVEKLGHYHMALLLDIVPNHMAASWENPWWVDLLEDGLASPYARFFDIEWSPPGPKVSILEKGRVLVPILGDRYDRVLVNQEIALRLDEKGFFVQYSDHRFPVNLHAYPMILEELAAQLKGLEGGQEFVEQIDALPEKIGAISSLPEPRHAVAKSEIKAGVWHLFHSERAVREGLEETLRKFNGVKDNPESFRQLDALLSMQVYRLADWRLAAYESNYRRFFDINDLIGLRVEDPAVFAAKHASTLKLIAEEKVMGLRVDHIDGLLDPLEYLLRLQGARSTSREEDSDKQNIYTIVEKITCGKETLPPEWPAAGTTGYDFMGALNTVFVDGAGYKELEAHYRKFAKHDSSFADTWYRCKKQVVEELFPADLCLLAYRLGRLAAIDPAARDLPMSEVIFCMKEIAASLPIYRTYVRDLGVSPRDRAWLEKAFELAGTRILPNAGRELALEFLKRVLLGLAPFNDPQHKDVWLSFVQRWQQFTTAVMAKGFEDTAFYIYHPLASMNEVGCDPLRDEMEFGVDAFHRFNQAALAEHPHTLTATSTHDTKWAEDVRARLNVLSEMPREWHSRLARWSRWNDPKKTAVNGLWVPTRNEEQFLYQQMLGIWPADSPNLEEIKGRLETVFLKAAKEAKTHTSWTFSNEEHEAALRNYLSSILEPSEQNCFLSDFTKFQERVAFYGAWNSLSQLLLKIASPGTPDFFQGNELWNFRLTDPDNRYPVDYSTRVKALDELKSHKAELPQAIKEILQTWRDGRLKLYLTMIGLNFRKAQRELFLKGDYVPLNSTGKNAESVIAFGRHYQGAWGIAIAPRLLTRVAQPNTLPIGRSVWGMAAVLLPDEAPDEWSELFTSEQVSATTSHGKRGVRVGDAFRRLPFALLTHTPAN